MDDIDDQKTKVAPSVSVISAVIGCIIVLVVMGVALVGMVKSKPQANKSEFVKALPAVEVYTVVAGDKNHTLEGRGVLESRREVAIASEVMGRITEISPQWKKGGIVKEGEQIARIDDADYAATRQRMAAAVAQAQEVLQVEETQAAMSISEWQRVSKEPPSSLTKHEPQLQRARAVLASAQADLVKAERDLARTKVVAPFSGRVRVASVEVGAIASIGMVIGEIYSDQEIDLRVPIRVKDMADIATDRAVEIQLDDDPTAQKWQAKFMGFDGEVNRETHTIQVMLQVMKEKARPFPAVGTFVRATLPLRSEQKRFTIPRQALQDGRYVHFVNDQDQVERRQVTFIRGDRDTALVEGVEIGQRIAVTRLQSVLPLMKVRVVSVL